MKQHHTEFSIKTMSRVFKVSRSGYYDWLARERRGPSPREQLRQARDERVRQWFDRRKGRDGSPNITRDLHALGDRCNRKTVADSMRRQGLRAKAAKKFKVTTDSKHTLPVAPNRLGRDFHATAPNQKWVGDITYLWTDEGWMYLATLIDLFSRAVIGWSLSNRMTRQLVSDALTMALWRRGFPKGVLVHSDRGSQYCSQEYQQLLNDHQLICSMSRKGNCWDNAVAESFFHTLKVEVIRDERFKTREQLTQTVFEYIEVDYNRNRRHSAIGHISPMAFEAQQVA
jgi:transposase InsO family protein